MQSDDVGPSLSAAQAPGTGAMTRMRPANRTYFHGTRSLGALAALTGGDCLRPRTPEETGRRRLAGAVAGYSYLSPNITIACRYAKASARLDRPRDWTTGGDSPDVGFVFAFDLLDANDMRLEEDELGHAVRNALEEEFGWANRFRDRHPNRMLGAHLQERPEIGEALCREARRCLPDSVFRTIDPRQRVPTIGILAKIGRLMADRMELDLGQALIDCGISLGVAGALWPKRAWSWNPWDAKGNQRGLPRDEHQFAAEASPLILAAPTHTCPLPGPEAGSDAIDPDCHGTTGLHC
jgi:hypothetical protein